MPALFARRTWLTHKGLAQSAMVIRYAQCDLQRLIDDSVGSTLPEQQKYGEAIFG